MLGLHLGMSGRIEIDVPPAPNGWDRFAIEFADGGRLALHDKRRLGRAVLEPDFSHVGPDAAEVGRDTFRRRVGRGTAPLKARLLDQGAIAGIGNLLADEGLWRARLSPHRVAGELSDEELDRLRRELRAGDAVGDPARGRAHGLGDRGAPRRRGLPALRGRDGARGGRGAHDVLVPRVPAGVRGSVLAARRVRQAGVHWGGRW